MENSYNIANVSNNPYTNYYTPIQLILPLDVSIIINSSDPVYKFDEVMRGVNLKNTYYPMIMTEQWKYINVLIVKDVHYEVNVINRKIIEKLI